jgi:hypothetical protein
MRSTGDGPIVDDLDRETSRAARAMTVRMPDHDAMRAADNFDAIPPLPRAVPALPAATLSRSSSGATVETSVASGFDRGSWV